MEREAPSAIVIAGPEGTPEDVARIRAALELGVAFQEAEAALPEGWIILLLEGDGMTWLAEAGPFSTPHTRDYLGPHGVGETLTEALRALKIDLLIRAEGPPAVVEVIDHPVIDGIATLSDGRTVRSQSKVVREPVLKYPTAT